MTVSISLNHDEHNEDLDLDLLCSLWSFDRISVSVPHYCGRSGRRAEP